MTTVAAPDEITAEVLAPPPRAALRSVQPKSAAFAADLDFAERGHGEFVRKIRTRTSAFSGAETLVGGGSVADDVGVSCCEFPGSRLKDKFLTHHLRCKESWREKYVDTPIV
jgi:hypothetical protein